MLREQLEKNTCHTTSQLFNGASRRSPSRREAGKYDMSVSSLIDLTNEHNRRSLSSAADACRLSQITNRSIWRVFDLHE